MRAAKFAWCLRVRLKYGRHHGGVGVRWAMSDAHGQSCGCAAFSPLGLPEVRNVPKRPGHLERLYRAGTRSSLSSPAPALCLGFPRVSLTLLVSQWLFPPESLCPAVQPTGSPRPPSTPSLPRYQVALEPPWVRLGPHLPPSFSLCFIANGWAQCVFPLPPPPWCISSRSGAMFRLLTVPAQNLALHRGDSQFWVQR